MPEHSLRHTDIDRGTGGAGLIYSPPARAMHWLTVLLLMIQIPLGIVMVRYAYATEFKAPSGQMYDAHKLLGLVILAVVAVRLAYRLMNGAPPDEPTLEPWQKLVSHLTHWAIYALLLAVPVLGWLAISYYGPFAPFGIKLPALVAENQDRATIVFKIHMAAALALTALIAMHVGAALFHHVVRKDGVLARMLPGLKR
ncbi:MAG: cytochrome b [Hyphomicrobiaceae bacterium]